MLIGHVVPIARMVSVKYAEKAGRCSGESRRSVPFFSGCVAMWQVGRRHQIEHDTRPRQTPMRSNRIQSSSTTMHTHKSNLGSLEIRLHPFLQLGGFNKPRPIYRVGLRSGTVRGCFSCTLGRLTHWCVGPVYAAPKAKAPRERLTI